MKICDCSRSCAYREIYNVEYGRLERRKLKPIIQALFLGRGSGDRLDWTDRDGWALQGGGGDDTGSGGGGGAN